MNKMHAGRASIIALALALGAAAVPAQPIGIAAKGGFPEYLFLEKVSRAQADATASQAATSSARAWASASGLRLAASAP